MGSESYLIGSGRVFFNDSNGWLNLGNIPSISLTRGITTLDHFTFASGARQKDLSLVTESSMGLSFTIDEFNKENLNILVFGNGFAASSQAVSSAVSEVQSAPGSLPDTLLLDHPNVSSVVVKDVTDAVTYTVDVDYEITDAVTGEINILASAGITASDVLHISYSYASVNDEVATAPVILDRSIFTAKTNISNLFVDNNAAKASPFTEDTDYEIVNATTGEIKILSTGSITTAMSLYLTYNYDIRTRSKVVPGKDFAITGSARIEIEVANGNPLTWKINNAELKIEGDTAISPDSWSEATIVLNILVDKTTTPTEPMGALYIG